MRGAKVPQSGRVGARNVAVGFARLERQAATGGAAIVVFVGRPREGMRSLTGGDEGEGPARTRMGSISNWSLRLAIFRHM